METQTSGDSAARYDAAHTLGERFLSDRWRFLGATTRAILVGSKFFSDLGQRLENENALVTAAKPTDDVERLEYILGVFKQCASMQVPARGRTAPAFAPDYSEADLHLCCDELLFIPSWHDPEFLRLALSALAAHHEATALAWAGPAPGRASGALSATFAMLKVLCVLVAPAAFASGLTSAMQGDGTSAGVGFYFFSAGVLAFSSLRKQVGGKPPSVEERTYLGWHRFRHQRQGGITGVGARLYLERLLADGVPIPSVAFDLCKTLEARMLRTTP